MGERKILYVLGIGSTAYEIRHSAILTGRWSAVYCVTPEGDESLLKGSVRFEDFVLAERSDYLFGMTRPEIREKWKLGKHELASVIDPSARVFDTAFVGAGSYIAAGVVVSHNARLGKRCLVNFNAVIGHDAELGDDVAINPNGTLGGNCKVGSRSLIGAGSFVFQGKRIGSDCQIDALSYVDRDIEDQRLVTSRGILKILPRRIG